MARKLKCKKVTCPPAEKWAVPTADFFSLLLALFIALFAIASVNTEKMKAIKEEFVKIYDYAPAPEEAHPVVEMSSQVKAASESTTSPVEKISVISKQSPSIGLKETPVNQSTSDTESVSDVIEKIQKELRKNAANEGPLDQSVDGVLLKLPAFVNFKGTSAAISDEDTKLFIKRIALIIDALPSSVNISVRGHTDDEPLPKDSIFKDNIELSASRASSVMRELIKNGVASERLSIAGFGSAKPLKENSSEENRADNRRVEFFMFIPNDMSLDKTTKKTVLDALEILKS